MSMTREDVVIVTGAGTGIGRATALRFAAAGATVVINGRRPEKLDAVREAAAGLPGPVVPFPGDVGDEDVAASLIGEAVRQGRLDTLVNNAGVGWSYGAEHPGAMAALADTPPEWWREVMRINLDSVYYTCHAALPVFLRQGGGNIVNVSSSGGLRGMNDAHTYSVTKAGVINLTRSLARAYGPKNVRANVVAPGFVDTDMVSPVLDSPDNPFLNDALRYQISPLGRPGRPEEIAAAIYFLSQEGTYCNGAVLVADGGSLA
jgi:NAD(P)-dependent dehydrogenase (short-subunit alcohol dehydrogenase family)